jgi:hypothetical protein
MLAACACSSRRVTLIRTKDRQQWSTRRSAPLRGTLDKAFTASFVECCTELHGAEATVNHQGRLLRKAMNQCVAQSVCMHWHVEV